MFHKVSEGILSFYIRIFNSIGFFVYVPLLSLWLVKLKGLNITEASVVIAIFTFISKAGSAVVGGIINKLGVKKSLLIGLWGSAVLLSILVIIDYYIIILFIVLMLGILISIYNVSLKTHISLLEEDKRLHAFALLNIAVNIGASIGPFLGGLALDWNPLGILIIAIICYLLAGTLTLLLPNIKIEELEQNLNILQFIKNRKYNRHFLIFLKFTVFSGVFWFLYSQIFTTFPVVVSKDFSGKTIGLFFTINALTVILFQGIYPKIQPKFKIENWYFFALVLIGISYFLIWISHDFLIISISIIIFSIAEIIWVPTIDSQVVAKKGDLSSSWAFGFSGVFWGIWESIGGLIGLNIYKYFGQQTFLCFTIICGVILVVYIFWMTNSSVTFFVKKQGVKREEL